MISEKLSTLNTENYKYLKRYKHLSYIGNIDLLHKKSVTIVGSRKCTSYGKRVVKDLCSKLSSSGVVTVSGFVEGVDMAVFKETLKAGGSTIVCLGYGFAHLNLSTLKRIYYTSVQNSKQVTNNKEINNPDLEFISSLEIRYSNLLIISQFKKERSGTRWTFPKRDELLASVGKGVVVVEAGKKSGTFYTVKHAFKEDKKVWAVPGSIYSHQSVGCHNLIKTGFKDKKAVLYNSYDQLCQYLNLQKKSVTAYSNEPSKDLSKEEKLILTNILPSGSHIDDIQRETGIESTKLTIKLTQLEIKGMIKKSSGSVYELL